MTDPGECALLVLQYLRNGGFSRSFVAFKDESEHLTQGIAATRRIKDLSSILSEYIKLKMEDVRRQEFLRSFPKASLAPLMSKLWDLVNAIDRLGGSRMQFSRVGSPMQPAAVSASPVPAAAIHSGLSVAPLPTGPPPRRKGAVSRKKRRPQRRIIGGASSSSSQPAHKRPRQQQQQPQQERTESELDLPSDIISSLDNFKELYENTEFPEKLAKEINNTLFSTNSGMGGAEGESQTREVSENDMKQLFDSLAVDTQLTLASALGTNPLEETKSDSKRGTKGDTKSDMKSASADKGAGSSGPRNDAATSGKTNWPKPPQGPTGRAAAAASGDVDEDDDGGIPSDDDFLADMEYENGA